MASRSKDIAYNDSSIQQLTMLQHARLRAEMYLGACDLDANVQVGKEFIDNSVDESIHPDQHYNVKIIIFSSKDRYQMAIVDYGRGIPCNKLAKVYTEAYTSGKYTTTAYGGNSTGTFGIGSKISVAVSKKFMGITKRLDGFAGVTIHQGVIKDEEQTKAIDKNAATVGTTIIYEPDDSILKCSSQYVNDPNGLARTIELIDYLGAFKQNTTITVYKVNSILPESWFKQSYFDKWNYLQELTGELVYETPKDTSPIGYVRKRYSINGAAVWDLELSRTVDIQNPMDMHGFDIGLYLTASPGKHNGIVASVNSNMMNTERSSHVYGIMNAIKEQIVKFIDEDDAELKLYFNTKYSLPVFGYIRAFYKNASFVGQTKDAFKNLDFDNLYRASILKQFKTIPSNKWEQFYDAILEDLMEKFTLANNRSLKVGKTLKNVAFNMLNGGCYIPCRTSDNTIAELLITEGDSSGDYVKSVRNAVYQAVLKLRGKPINAITADSATLRTNDVYQDMVRILGVSPRDTDLKNINFNTIGLLADADPDGYHILCLLIGCLYKINPLILSSGKVFIANPPLYVLDKKDKSFYLRDQKALNDARAKIYQDYFDIELKTAKSLVKLDHNAFRDFIYLTRRIGTLITDVANKLVIDPFILEQLTHCVDHLTINSLNCEKIKEILKLDRCSFHDIANTLLLVSGGAEINIPLSRLVHEIKSYILPELELVHWESFDVLLTTKYTPTFKQTPQTFIQLFNIFEAIDTQFPVRRLKGLGECTEEQLRATCVDPTTRSYSTITSLGDVDRIFKLLGVDTTAKKLLVQKDLKQLFEENN